MTLLLAIVAVAARHAGPTIDDYLQPDLHDATLVGHILKGDQVELRKINSTFGQAYRFETTTARYKDPFMLRLDSKVEDTSVEYILNGVTQVMKVPRSHISLKQNLSKAPGRRQTAFDFGWLLPSLFQSFYNAEFVRMDRATDEPVFDLTYKDRIDTSRSRIWVDPKRHFITKREWYNQQGRLLATFYFDQPEQKSGVWLPTRLTVKNADDMIAGVTRYDSIQINTGISDSVFAVD